MKIEEVIDLYQKDCKIDETELSRESLNTPILHGKYLKIYSEERLKLRSFKIKRDELTSKLMDYYKGDLNNSGSYTTDASSSNNLGDLNSDGSIDILDVILLVNIILGS